MFILIGPHVRHFSDRNQTVCPTLKKLLMDFRYPKTTWTVSIIGLICCILSCLTSLHISVTVLTKPTQLKVFFEDYSFVCDWPNLAECFVTRTKRLFVPKWDSPKNKRHLWLNLHRATDNNLVVNGFVTLDHVFGNSVKYLLMLL
jgi:hypothetical protein